MFVAPHPSPTPCSVNVPTSVNITWPSKKLRISQASITNFQRYNNEGHGRLLVIVNLDGTKKALVARSRAIDAELRAALSSYANTIVASPTIACGRAAAVFLMQFDVPSGGIHYVALPEHPRIRVQVPTPPPP